MTTHSVKSHGQSFYWHFQNWLSLQNSLMRKRVLLNQLETTVTVGEQDQSQALWHRVQVHNYQTPSFLNIRHTVHKQCIVLIKETNGEEGQGFKEVMKELWRKRSEEDTLHLRTGILASGGKSWHQTQRLRRKGQTLKLGCIMLLTTAAFLLNSAAISGRRQAPLHCNWQRALCAWMGWGRGAGLSSCVHLQWYRCRQLRTQCDRSALHSGIGCGLVAPASVR